MSQKHKHEQGVHSPVQLLYCTVVYIGFSKRIVRVFMVGGLVSLVSSEVQW